MNEYKEAKAEFLHAVNTNSMTTSRKRFCILFRPNNYRREIVVKKKTNSTIKNIKSAIGISFSKENFNFSNHTKLISIKNYKGITIQYGKETLTGIYTQHIREGRKLTMQIEADSIEDINKRLDIHRDKIKETIDKALVSFARQFKLSKGYISPKWTRHEDWIKGDDFIDKIPEDTIIHDTVFKKVYKTGIEFSGGKGKDPIAYIKNYIKNRAIEDIAPDIAEAINSLIDMIDPLKAIKSRVRRIEDLIREKYLVSLLSKDERADLEEWIFKLGC